VALLPRKRSVPNLAGTPPSGGSGREMNNLPPEGGVPINLEKAVQPGIDIDQHGFRADVFPPQLSPFDFKSAMDSQPSNQATKGNGFCIFNVSSGG
jgi:hypothetical protein